MAKGIGGGFKLDSSVNVLTNVSPYLRNIAGGSDVERIDETVLQPDVPAPVKTEVAGFRTFNYTLTVLWSSASFLFFQAIEGMEGLDYEHGPQGFSTGDQKIYGLCNCLSVGMPSQSTTGTTEFTVELNVTSSAPTETPAPRVRRSRRGRRPRRLRSHHEGHCVSAAAWRD
jgi:hypothetical protein